MSGPDNQAGSDTSSYTLDFGTVLKREYAELWLRRPEAAREEAGTAAETGEQPPPALYGVALSGGGIRSASFCLGALQALDQQGLAERIDYLSTVSGGGYTGASMIAAMRKNGERFPFSTGKGSDVHDNEPVNHLRDHSRFLAPRGSYDLLISLAVILRGLVVNFILVLALLLPLATFMVLANPTRAHLERSIVLDMAEHFVPAAWQAHGAFRAVLPYLAEPFLLTKVSAILLLASLLFWALRRSFLESHRPAGASRIVEQESGGAYWGRKLIIALAVAAVLELQPPILLWLITLLQAESVTPTGAGTLGTLAAALVTLTATFRGTLVGWIEKALNTPTLGAWLQALLARSILYLAGLALPLMIYALFLIVTLWGIRAPACDAPTAPEGFRLHSCPSWPDNYPLTPDVLAIGSIEVVWVLLALCVVVGVATIASSWSRSVDGSRLRMFIREIFVERRGLALASVAGLVFLALAAFATRAGSPGEPIEWVVLFRYALSLLLIWLVGWNFTENANGLHRLYRDRLNVAFRLGHAKDEPLRLSDLDDSSPYILVNATLNVREADRGDDENPTADPEAPRRTDPAKRGRNAEFFVFSRLFVGSAATGFASTRDMESIDAQLDLATAAAISGAAVSSSMGRINIGLLGPTLALLNLRLGYWLTNPREAQSRKASLQSTSGQHRPRRSWHDRLRLYLFAEAFGRLRADSSRVYVTDGGHIDNIGLYQLLKRRCKFIVVIDSEADAAMTFSAFNDVQRFARIDDGVRIIMDWMPIRDAATARAADRNKRAAPDDGSHDRHFAVGKILYEKDGGEIDEGVLLYVKASVTGDEADYVLDYERRYPLFPHESTGDQFFSEEQMEAYRALGFHCVARALAADKTRKGSVRYGGQADEDAGPVTAMIRELRETAPTTRLAHPRPIASRRTP